MDATHSDVRPQDRRDDDDCDVIVSPKIVGGLWAQR